MNGTKRTEKTQKYKDPAVTSMSILMAQRQITEPHRIEDSGCATATWELSARNNREKQKKKTCSKEDKGFIF
jgi:hypothetical protein